MLFNQHFQHSNEGNQNIAHQKYRHETTLQKDIT